jgi:rhamnulokinase
MPSSPSNYLALDLGAESGRGLHGRFDGERLTLDEVHRFPNGPVKMLDTIYWDLPGLFEEIKNALRKAASGGARFDGIGVDTWGVDFALIGRNDTLLGNPVHYRDCRTDGMLEAACTLVSRERIYEITGLQFLPFNTVFQLLALRKTASPLLEVAETMLLMADVFGWLLTGRRAVEYTNATTTQLLDARTRNWSDELCRGLELPRSLLPEIIEPGAELGPLRWDLAAEMGLKGVPVIAPATHDTGSAVAAVPASSRNSGPPDWCYLSSGTWSLLGVEVREPIINEATRRHNFTNEGGVDGTIRLLKNIMGLWLVQECRRAWSREGRELSYEELIPRAEAAPAFRSLINPDDPSFLAPGDMPARIAAFCAKTGQPAPEKEGAFVRCALESLALKYRWTIERLEEITGGTIRTIHVVGGGARNSLLNQLTADATGRVVKAGPIEATAIGNILIQARARGRIGSLNELREVVERSFPVAIYEPIHASKWSDVIGKFDTLMA